MFTSVGRRTLIFLVLSCVSLTVHAQSTSASMTGFVTDASGAVVPNATVTITNLASGVSTTAHTNGAGLYLVSGLLPGTYRATVTAKGFKSDVRDGIQLHLEDQLTVSYSLAVGSVNETVTVQSQSSVIETDSPTVSQVIEGRQVEDTPLNGRNVMNLVALTPGVTPQGSTSGSALQNNAGGGATNTFGWDNYQVSGGLAGESSEYLDGGPLNILYGHTSSLVPTQDAIQEFRVETSVVNPRYGAFGGGVVSFVTKSGANDVHGTVYEYFRNTVLDANNFFNNLLGQPRSKLNQNQFGTLISGPIKREKAFAMFSYEGYREALGVPESGRIPTPAELTGNFSADSPIYDPTTGHQFACNGTLNVICANRIDPTANVMATVITYWPTPNTNQSTINYARNASAGSTSDQYTGRVDGSVGRHKLFGRYTYWLADQKPTQAFFGNKGPTAAGASDNATQQVVLGDTYVVSNSTILDLRASYLRFTFVTVAPTVNLSAFGPFYAAIQSQVSYSNYPDVSIAGTLNSLFTNLDVTVGGPANNYNLVGTITRVAGRNTLSAGGEVRRQDEYLSNTNNPVGLSSFAGVYTGCSASCTTPTGSPATPTAPGAGATPIADFMLGLITSSNGFTEVHVPAMVSNYGGVSANDVLQASLRLTMTFGVRWEMPGGFTEKRNFNAILLPQLANPLQLVASSAYPSRSDLEPHRTLFSPRIGLAYKAAPTTTVRAGYSLAFLPQDLDFIEAPFESAINAATTFVAPGALLSNPLGGSTTLVEPVGRAYNGTQYLGSTIVGRIPDQSFPYLNQWNANVQQSIGQSTLVQVGYLGTRGKHIPVGPVAAGLDINQIPDQYDGLPAAQLSQSLRPYPQYKNITVPSDYVGTTAYDSLQASLVKRFAGGGTLLANYTWSKFLGNAEAFTKFVETGSVGGIQDFNNLKAEYSLESFNTPQRFVVSYALDLPFGHGKKYLGSAGGVVDHVVGGWTASGISTFASGFPLAISAISNTLSGSYGAGTIRPNVVAGCGKSLGGSIVVHAQSATPVLNQSCFTQPGATSFGNEPRVDSTLAAQGIDNWDFSASKTTKIRENVNLQFRAEIFNTFNRVQFGSPNTSSGSALFGHITSQSNQPRIFQFSLRTNF